MNGISSILSSTVPVLGSLLSSIYFQYFLDKVSLSFFFSMDNTICNHKMCIGYQHVYYNSSFVMQLAASLGPRFYLNIYKCKHISETGAQQVRMRIRQRNFVLFSIFFITLHFFFQMLLDTQAVKTILLDIPALGKQVTSSCQHKIIMAYFIAYVSSLSNARLRKPARWSSYVLLSLS